MKENKKLKKENCKEEKKEREPESFHLQSKKQKLKFLRMESVASFVKGVAGRANM